MAEILEEARHQRALSIIKRFRLLDDDFMKRCFKNNYPAVECILRIILQKKDLVVKKLEVEDTIPNLQGRGVRFDVHAIDSKGKEYDIEIQRSDEGAGRKRARYNSSLLDLNSLKKGQTHEHLPETYVIFITENDVLQHRRPLYHVERIIQEMEEPFADGEHILYVNGAYEGTDELGRLMHDFRSRDYKEMNFEPLRETVKRYKENPEEVSHMCKELEDWMNEEKKEAVTKVALEFIKQKVPLDVISNATKLSIDELKVLARKNGLAV